VQLRSTGMSTDATSPATTATQPLPDDPVILQQMIRELLATLQTRDRENEHLRHRLDLLLRRFFGPRAEKYDPNQAVLFPDLQTEAAVENPPAEPAEAKEPAPPARQRGHGRQKLPGNLPRVPVLHDVPEAQRLCPGCGQACTCIGQDTSEQLDYVPASLFVKQHIWPKYVCRHCCKHVTLTEKPAQVIDKGLPGPGLLAQVAVSKFVDHLPLYRQERIFSRHGVELSRTTMCTWMAACAQLLKPLYALMITRVLLSQVIHTDDTPVPVLDPKQDKTKTGRLWVYLGDELHPYNVFAYSPSRQRLWPADFLRDFAGFLQADAFSGYDALYLKQPITEVGCNAHARRKFYDAKDSDQARAHQALAFYRELYEVEHRATEEVEEQCQEQPGLDASGRQQLLEATRLRLRQAKAVPILTTMCQWLQEQQAQVLPKSPIGQAIGYALNHWQALTRYTEQGFLAIDNNIAEREMKRIATGRKNWLFAGSDRGGHTAAVLYSFTSTCQRHQIDPFAYLRDTFERLPAHPADRLEEFLPERWAECNAAKRR
jgi:transposase